MKIGVNGRVFGIETPAGAAQVGIRHTRNLIDTGNQCLLYGHRDSSRCFDDPPDARTVLFPWNSQAYGIVWERSVLPALAAKDDLDVLFCPNANAPPTPASNYETVAMIHHIGAEHGHSSLQRLYRKATIPLGVRAADAVVTVSAFSKRQIVDQLPVHQSDVHVVYNGIDQLFFEDGGGDPIDVPEEYVLFVGSADERKNLSGLLEAYTELDTECELVVVGPTDTLAYGHEDADRDGITNLGYVTKRELKYVYENAAVFAYPSLYEGFGLPPLEAAACGTPVVTSNVTAMPEVMGDAAEYVDPSDVDSIRAGLEIVHDPARLAELRERGPKRARRYTWEQATDRLLDVFQQIV